MQPRQCILVPDTETNDGFNDERDNHLSEAARFPVSCIGSMCSHPHTKLRWVPRLHKYRPRSCEFADKTFPTADTGDDASASHALHDVFGVPGDQMAVVDDILFAFFELHVQSAKRY